MSEARRQRPIQAEINGDSIQSYYPTNQLLFETVQFQLSRSLGKILAILDASIADGHQSKACKDLVRTEMNEALNALQRGNTYSNEMKSYIRLGPIFE